MREHTQRRLAGTLYPPDFFFGWIPFGHNRPIGSI
jgi:hypothetical protein